MTIKVTNQTPERIEIPVKGAASGARAIRERIEKQLDKSYELVPVDYNDQMPAGILEIYLEKGEEAARDAFYEDNDISAWINDCEWDNMHQIISDLCTDEELDQLNEFEEYGILQDTIYNLDNSTPFNDLMRRADSIWAVYDLDIEVSEVEAVIVDHPKYGKVAAAVPASHKKLAKDLGLDAKTTNEKLLLSELLSNASYGGSVQLLLNTEVDKFNEMIDGEKYTFKNVGLAIIDYVNGSGHDVEVDAITVKWDRSKLKASNFYADEVCGLVANQYQKFTIEKAS